MPGLTYIGVPGILRSSIAVAFGALLLSAPLAHADVAKLSATYDGFLENTVFTITNDSAVSEAVRLTTSLGPTTQVSLPNLATGASETYSFSQISGGFENDPASAGLPDTTTYTLLVGLNNASPTLSSNVFSPLSNLTGGDVDFLGTNCNGFAGGSGNASGTCGGTDALSGLVATVPNPQTVPEPQTLALLVSGVAILGMARRRPKRGFGI